MILYIFFIRYGTRTGFLLDKKPNRKPIPCTGVPEIKFNNKI